MNSTIDDTELLEAIYDGKLQASPQVLALLQELLDSLRELASHGKQHQIDIRSLPLTPQDHEMLMRFLGHGEVSAKIHALGVSEINETRFSGIWLLTHYNAYAEIVAEIIEVTSLPDILKTQVPDLQDSTDALQRFLQQLKT